jgi:hypothetical protein
VRTPLGSNPATNSVRLGSALLRLAFSRSRTFASFLANSTRRRRRSLPHSLLRQRGVEGIGAREEGEGRSAA